MTQERRLLGAGILFGGILAVATMDVVGKILSTDIPVWQVSWARFFFHGVFLSPLAFLAWRRLPPGAVVRTGRRMRWGFHILRGLMLSASSIFFFLAIRDNPVPDSLAIFFVEPLIVMLMARFFLREAFDRRLLIAACGGMVGVLIILRPGGDYNWTILFALAAAFSFAIYLVSARFASHNTPAPITSWLTAVFGLLPLLPMMFFWQVADARLWGLMIFLGFLSGIGHTLIILALKYIRASLLAVLHYAEIGVAALLSWVVFNHWPDAWVWSGIGVIVAANLFALRVGGKPKLPAAPMPM